MELNAAAAPIWAPAHTAANGAAVAWKELGNSSNTTAACKQLGLTLQCVDPRDMLSNGGHGDFYPACTATETPYVPYPTAVAARDEARLPTGRKRRQTAILYSTTIQLFSAT
jgi:hypothetical protein